MIESVVLIGLASWRIANLLINEDGPFDVFERLRQFIGLKEGPVEGFLPKLFSCIYCLSVWSTIFAYLTWEVSHVPIIILAAMSTAIIIDRVRT